MLVFNYVLWIDIYVINSWYLLCFVVKLEICNWLVIGWLCVQIGVLFVECVCKCDVYCIMYVIVDVMCLGDVICVFFEGIMFDGLQLLLFYVNLFQVFVSVGVLICLLVLWYCIVEMGVLMIIFVYIGDLLMMDMINVMLNGLLLVVEVFVGFVVVLEMDCCVLVVYSYDVVVMLIVCVGQVNWLFIFVCEWVLCLFVIYLDYVMIGWC